MKQQRKYPSVPIAKNRLKTLVESDRIVCNAKDLERLKRELSQTITKYINVKPERLDFQLMPHSIKINIQEKISEN